MKKHLVYLDYDCETGYARRGRWEMWNHKPEIGFQPGGRCYSWVSGTSNCQESESSCYLQVEKIAESLGDKIRALVEYNRDKGFVLNIENAEEKSADEFKVQFNPDREKRVGRLSGQRQDPKHPKCILDAAIYSNVPEFLDWRDYCLFPNPYPIFKDDHFTLVYKEHEEQRLTPEKIKDALDFLYEAPSFRIIFNGINAGATSPDHLHFQGFSHRLPIEDFDIETILSDSSVRIGEPRDYPATTFVVEGSNMEQLTARAYEIVRLLNEPIGELKPTYNILFSTNSRINRIYIFPRNMEIQKSEFYGSKPATIEMSGMLIMSKDEDKEKYENADSCMVRRVLEDVTIPKERLHFVYDKIKLSARSHFI